MTACIHAWCGRSLRMRLRGTGMGSETSLLKSGYGFAHVESYWANGVLINPGLVPMC